MQALHLFDSGGTAVFSKTYGGLQELSFAVAALLCSISNYAGDSGWELEQAEMDDCRLQYHRGGTGLLWLVLTNDTTITSEQLTSQMQVADMLVASLLGMDACRNSRHDVLKKSLRGVADCINAIFAPREAWPNARIPMPQLALCGPSSAARACCQLPYVVAAAAGCASAALLVDGMYSCNCPPTASWLALHPRQQLVLQLLLVKCSQEAAGEVRVQIQSADANAGEQGFERLLWASPWPGTQVVVLCGSSEPSLDTYQQQVQAAVDAAHGEQEQHSLRNLPPSSSPLSADARLEGWLLLHEQAQQATVTMASHVVAAGSQMETQRHWILPHLQHQEVHHLGTAQGVATTRSTLFVRQEGAAHVRHSSALNGATIQAQMGAVSRRQALDLVQTSL